MPATDALHRATPHRAALFGAGGFGREVAWLLRETAQVRGETADLVFVTPDLPLAGVHPGGVPAISETDFAQAHRDRPALVTLGDPTARRKVAETAAGLGARFATAIHPGVRHSDSVTLGEGTILCAGTILTVDITLGCHVHVNLDCTIGHDCRLSDFATLAPGVHVSGAVEIGADDYIGTGAVILNGDNDRHLSIGAGAVVGAGACVTRDVPPGTTVVGIPAKPLPAKSS